MKSRWRDILCVRMFDLCSRGSTDGCNKDKLVLAQTIIVHVHFCHQIRWWVCSNMLTLNITLGLFSNVAKIFKNVKPLKTHSTFVDFFYSLNLTEESQLTDRLHVMMKIFHWSVHVWYADLNALLVVSYCSGLWGIHFHFWIKTTSTPLLFLSEFLSRLRAWER